MSYEDIRRQGRERVDREIARIRRIAKNSPTQEESTTPNHLVNLSQASEILGGISTKTVRSWADTDGLTPETETPRRYRRESIEALLRNPAHRHHRQTIVENNLRRSLYPIWR